MFFRFFWCNVSLLLAYMGTVMALFVTVMTLLCLIYLPALSFLLLATKLKPKNVGRGKLRRKKSKVEVTLLTDK
jgi:hypothetical protein